MKQDTAFRLSTYLTFILALACLGYAERVFLPGIIFFAVPIGILLAAAFAAEGRWLLTTTAANLLGLLIAAGAGVWLVYHLVHLPVDMTEAAPRPALMLPYMGPVLMILMLAKSFRPKQINDFWLLHLVALLEATLACVLAADPFFGVFLFAYLVAVAWSLAQFHLNRERQRARAHRLDSVPSRFPAALSSGPGPGPAFRWAVVVASLALVLFLLTPPLGENPWDPFTLSSEGGMTTGYAEGLDLHRTGRVRISNKVAFEVVAHNADNRPKLDVNPAQRWRGTILYLYYNGHWRGRSVSLLQRPTNSAAARKLSPTELPDLGPEQYFFTFRIDTDLAQGLFLADPVILPPARDKMLPVVALNDEDRIRSLFQVRDGSLLPVPCPRTGTYIYRQVTAPAEEEGLGAPINPDLPFDEKAYRDQQPVQRLHAWTAALLHRLEEEGKLAKDDVQYSSRNASVPPENWEKVARVLADHLALSGEYTYTLELRRQDPRIDPIEDFLCNIKQGHCQRYASGLALMLRSCGIPARVIGGFRGAEPRGDDGGYVVRQCHAHSWVEALIYRRGPDGGLLRHWLTLDPTPAEEARFQDMPWWSRAWKEFEENGSSLWRDYIVEYNAEQRHEAGSALRGQLDLGRTWLPIEHWFRRHGLGSWGRFSLWLFVGLLLAGIYRLARRHWKKRSSARARRPAVALECYASLLFLLEQYLRLSPRRAQTPREFADVAETALRKHASTAPWAELPVKIVCLLYRFRFGRETLNAAESREIDRQLEEMGAGLMKARGAW